ncbi:hypothetical protein NEPAR06_0176 [Nematocida parisii]|uniref:Uncharacterized protein n=1 Tax=Nematocida parisii (strain ERTm3) TaxID=935791 RepID=I3EDF9_NEMP3|nr:uncharacterized protein NEPG_00570 [Nematocida parisii ERTm1]EIJ87256.1 hypothetical protein NEQG_02591 [Nematocida parisii ERTm3]KAI5126637.1 hypothetical protein NEPAR08_0556 [Nematocida parisii]EIJ95045.1 hypothetical protein NEPG_00570 [Nematocida parisii ERTm1]KAI5127920.1 hypothetical protein NEPAR03_1200 [Nematocida parisii]KAI5142858.1 hypothetical protein NEPAR04_1678 [Nematocida parisii]|eukprot:XP_013058401.1 hypothetical protein NEPG_00570 [Nematocida parisii ERTm1]
MEHNPSFSSVHPIEGIQTANKNIYSYFMKNDNSYCVDSKHRYSLYRKETDKTYIVVISKYESNTGDYTYKHNSNSIEMECLIGESKHNLHTKKVTLSNLFKTIREIEYSLPGTEDIKASDIFIGLVYPDGLNRVSIMNMVDSVLNHSGFKGILLLPLTLSVCFGLGLSNSVVYSEMDKTVTLVEDNCVFDTFTADRPGSTTLYGSDVVEEFLRKEEPVKNTLEMACFMCNVPFEVSEFGMHFLNKHMIDIYADQKHSDTLLHKCVPKEEAPAVEEPTCTDLDTVGKDMLRKLAPPERSTKITSTVVFITNKSIPEAKAEAEDETHENEGAEAEPADSHATPEPAIKIVPPIIDESTTSTILYVEDKKKAHTAWNGVFALANIEPSKDLWLTDKEWRSVGLRVLKEKVLFSI